MIQVNGMAHVLLTVSSFDAAPAFYDQLLPFLGLSRVFRGDKFAYWVGGRSAVGIQRCDDAYRSETFVQYRVGLHHLCFRAKERDDLETAATFLRQIGASVVRGPQAGDWAPGYYYVLFEDPDKIRLEICHVPGSAVLAKDATLNPASDF